MNSGGVPSGTGAGAAPFCGVAGAGEGSTGVAGTRDGAERPGGRVDGTAAGERRLDSRARQHTLIRAAARGRRAADPRERDRRAWTRRRTGRLALRSARRRSVAPARRRSAPTPTTCRSATRARGTARCAPTSWSTNTAITAATTAARQTEPRVDTPAAVRRHADITSRQGRRRSGESGAALACGSRAARLNTPAACARSAPVPAGSRPSAGSAKMFDRSTASARLSTGSAIRIYLLRRRNGQDWPPATALRAEPLRGSACISCSTPELHRRAASYDRPRCFSRLGLT